MPLYRCQHCNYTTSRKSNHIRHLKTHKQEFEQHTNRSEKNKIPKNVKISPIFTRKSAKNELFLDSEPCKITQNYPKLPEITRFLNSENFGNTDYCIFCQKEFSSIYHAKRHMLNSCKVRKYYQQEEIKKKEEEARKEEKAKLEKLELEEIHQKHISLLLEKVGNTVINNNCQTTNTTHHTQNNTLQLNNFGNEDLTMLTEKYMRNMVIYPYTAIPKMIKKIHFNDKYPANKNIRMLNKKDNKIQIRNNNKWEFVDKKETLEQLINEKNYQLDIYFEKNKETFDGKHQDRFDSFQDKINDGDRDVMKSMNTGSELIFWNSM